MWNSRVPLVEERDHSETFIQKVDAPDKFIEEARAAQDELGLSRESIAAERELRPWQTCKQMIALISVVNCGHAKSPLTPSASAPKVLDKNLKATREALAAEHELSACSTRKAGEARMNQEDAQSAKVRAEADLIQFVVIWGNVA